MSERRERKGGMSAASPGGLGRATARARRVGGPTSDGWSSAPALTSRRRTIKVPFRSTACDDSGRTANLSDYGRLISGPRRQRGKAQEWRPQVVDGALAQCGPPIARSAAAVAHRTTGTRFYEPLLVNAQGVKELPSLMSQSIQASSSA